MINEQKVHSAKRQNFIIILCWLLYTCSYLGKYTFNASITSVQSFYRVGEDEAGLIGSVFFFSYGAGQIINGIFCKFYNKKYVMAGAIIVSSIINLSIYFGIPFNYIKYIWFVNGFALSCLWCSIMLLLSENLESKFFAKAVTALSFTTPIGTILAYAMSALFVQWFTFKITFLTGGITLFVMGIVWLLTYNKGALNKQEVAYLYRETSTAENPKEPSQNEYGKRKVAKPIIVLIIILGIFSILNAFMRDGLTTWVPNILKNNYPVPESLAIILTLVVPLFGMVGAFASFVLNRKISGPISLCAVFFFGETVTITCIVLLFKVNMWAVLFLLGLLNLCAHGIANLLTSILPLTMRDKVNSGLLSGLLNGACYIGATISTYGLGVLQTVGMNWNNIFIILIIVSILPIITSLLINLVALLKKKV